jgi:uncharacterized protein YjfI (DUF2170 family)
MKKMVQTKGVAAMTFAVLVAVILMVLPEMAMAAGNVNQILSNKNFMPIVKFGLGLYAAWKWFEYFSNFSPNSAFKDIIVPALITYLAFQIDTVLGFFGLNSL